MAVIKLSVALNQSGHPIGQHHGRAVLTDAEVEQLVAMHVPGEFGYRRLAAIFGISPGAARKYIKGTARCQIPAGFKIKIIKTET